MDSNRLRTSSEIGESSKTFDPFRAQTKDQITKRETKEYKEYKNMNNFIVDHVWPAYKRGTYSQEEWKEKDKIAMSKFDAWRETGYKIYEED